MIKDVETNSEKYKENPTWDDIHIHRKRQFTTERGFEFVDHYFKRQNGPAWEERSARYSRFDKNLFNALKGRDFNRKWHQHKMAQITGHTKRSAESVSFLSSKKDP